jgi:membrane protein
VQAGRLRLARRRCRDYGCGDRYYTALLFTVGEHLISLYIGSSNMASIYGAAGALIIVLVWVYYSAQILLLGAEFAKAQSDQRRARLELRQTTRAVS